MSGRAVVVLIPMMLVQLISPMGEARRVDMGREIAEIIRLHNAERMDPNVRAPYMMEMSWDTKLAADALRFASKCEYRRPNNFESDWGSNLFYRHQHTADRHGVHQVVSSAVRSWTRGKSEYRPGESCGETRSCDYAQMVYYKTDKVGCAINTCESLQAGTTYDRASLLFVCLYSPKIDPRRTYENFARPSCSNCPGGYNECSNGLCTHHAQDTGIREVEPYIPKPAPTASTNQFDVLGGALTSNEAMDLLSAHNRIRQQNGRLDPLTMDPYLVRWVEWIIRCEADYPGPRHTFTNFARLQQGDTLYNLIFEWSNEGSDVYQIFDHGCRSPNDRERCNHNTNVMQPGIDSMACAAKSCDLATRQVVCIYDTRAERPSRRRETVTARPARTRPERPAPIRSRDNTRRRDNIRRREMRRREMRRRQNNRRRGNINGIVIRRNNEIMN